MTTDAASTIPFPQTPPDVDLQDRIDTVLDQDAASGDILPVLARLLIDMATKRNEPPDATGGSLQVFPSVSERLTDEL